MWNLVFTSSLCFQCLYFPLTCIIWRIQNMKVWKYSYYLPLVEPLPWEHTLSFHQRLPLPGHCRALIPELSCLTAALFYSRAVCTEYFTSFQTGDSSGIELVTTVTKCPWGEVPVRRSKRKTFTTWPSWMFKGLAPLIFVFRQRLPGQGTLSVKYTSIYRTEQ